MQCDACLVEPATGLWRLEPEMLATSVERENIAARVGGARRSRLRVGGLRSLPCATQSRLARHIAIQDRSSRMVRTEDP